MLVKHEGIIPALESAHAVAEGLSRAREMNSDQILVINVSGRGDKDLFITTKAFGDEGFTDFYGEQFRIQKVCSADYLTSEENGLSLVEWKKTFRCAFSL